VKGVEDMDRTTIDSSIVWFYYDGLADAARFYGELLGLDLVLDQGWARIYKASGCSFVGLVDASAGKGHCDRASSSAVLLTLVVDDVDAWYARLEATGAPIDRGIETMDEIEVRCFFLRDPGGYAVEIQQFMNPETARDFHPTKRSGHDRGSRRGCARPRNARPVDSVA